MLVMLSLLRSFFSKFGETETGPLGFDSVTGRSRGFALFVYKNQDWFRKALEEPHKIFEGHQLHCQKAADGKNKGPVSAPVTVPLVQQPAQQMLAAGLNIGVDNAIPSVLPGLGLQNAYPKKKGGSAAGSGSGSRSQVGGGSFSGYPSHMW
ncbi:hypothetical protein L1987_37142 [Smallanthus sonchifolius]|uniref:Uncharacterized protein n=1 Tax=Smallanthus sonchifolius TaxID=185202 RepID=A0ACB9HHB5_9ASTR|nr:hypothetical protein L1987_37142 [Smallanthus sonchifolius]